MHPSQLIDIPSLLRRYSLKPDQRLGQNFLIEPAVLQRIVQAGNLGFEDTVLEIGPGLGSLTCLLAENTRHVIAVELDKKIIPVLRGVLSPYPNVCMIQGDILSLDPSALVGKFQDKEPYVYKVVANIPYNITSALIRHLLETCYPPSLLVLTVQLEVAERICALPGKMNLLAISVQVYGEPQLIHRIPAGSFYPPPKVDSAIIRIDLYNQPVVKTELIKVFFQLAKAGFSQKRKTLRNALSGGMGWTPQHTADVLLASGIDPQRRAETLSLEEWRQLTTKLIENRLD